MVMSECFSLFADLLSNVRKSKVNTSCSIDIINILEHLMLLLSFLLLSLLLFNSNLCCMIKCVRVPSTLAQW